MLEKGGVVLNLTRDDIPALTQLADGGDNRSSFLALSRLVHLAPEETWSRVRPLFFGDGAESNKASNIIGPRHCPEALEDDLIDLLKQYDKLPRHSTDRLLELLRKSKVFSPEAVALYRHLADSGEMTIRSEAYRCLFAQASDESLALVARKALDGDEPAMWTVASSPDRRFAETFDTLVDRAIEHKQNWLGGHVHCWPGAARIEEYVNLTNSPYKEILMKKRRVLAETPPESMFETGDRP
jgi:hypothetical protein